MHKKQLADDVRVTTAIERDRLWCQALIDEDPEIIARVTKRFLDLLRPPKHVTGESDV